MDLRKEKLGLQPFEDVPDPRLFFETPTHLEALRALIQAVESDRALSVLTGDAGTGKTLLACCLPLRIDPANFVRVMTCTPGDGLSLIGRAAELFGANTDKRVRRGRALTKLITALHIESAKYRRMVLVVDQAEHLTSQTVVELEAMSAHRHGACPAIQIILVGQPPVVDLLRRSTTLSKRATILSPLRNLSADESRAYVQHRWCLAVGGSELPLNSEALDRLLARAGGNPRGILQHCSAELAPAVHTDTTPASSSSIADTASVDHDDRATTDEHAPTPSQTIGSFSMPGRSEGYPIGRGSYASSGSQHSAHIGPQSPPVDAFAPPDDRASQLGRLVDRMENALQRAPGIIAALEAAATKPERLIARIDTGVEDLERRQEALQQHFSGLERTCARAEDVQLGLTDFVGQLAEVGDTSQEKISLLMDSLEAGNRARQQLQEMTNDVELLTQRLAADVRSHEERLSDVAQTHLSTVKRTFDAQRDDLRRIIEHELEPFRENGEHANRLQSTVERGLATINRDLDRKCRSITETIDSQTERFESSVHDRDRDFRELAERCAESVNEARDASVSELSAQLEQRFAPFTANGEHVTRLTELVAGGVETLNQAADLQRKKYREEIIRSVSRVKAVADERERHLQSITTEAVELWTHAKTEAAAQLQQQIERLLAPFAADGEQTARITDMVTRATDAIARAGSQCVQKLNESLRDHQIRANEEAGTKVQQLASQLQASRESIRMASESTQEVQKLLGSLLEQQSNSESAMAKLAAAAQEARQVAETLDASRESAAPSVTAIKECLEGSNAVIDKIERLIQDVWTVTTTAQERARQVTERVEKATDVIAEFEEAERAFAERTANLSDQSADAKKTGDSLVASVQQAEAIMDQLATISTEVSHSATAVAETAERTKANQQQLEAMIDRSGEAVSCINAAVVNAAGVSERIGNESEGASEVVCDLGVMIERSEKSIEQMTTICDSLSKAMSNAVQRVAQADGATEKLQKSLERADATTGIFSTRLKHADALVQRIDSAERFANQAIENLEAGKASHDALITRLQKQVDTGSTLADELADRLSESAAASKTLSDQIEQAKDTHRDVSKAGADLTSGLRELIASASTTRSDLQEAVKAAADAGQIAREAAQQMEAGKRDSAGLVETLTGKIEAGTRLMGEIGDTLKSGAAFKDEVNATVSKARDTSREISDILTTITESRALLEANEQSITEFINHAESLRIKLQQLETRSDAFGHQLNSMLTEPKKVVENAKAQAVQLDRVCSAVRKVFSGLSQTSLQANRNIARFTQISREANSRLAKITSESKRTTQTLREWVDEALHVQKRLSRTLAQVPAIDQTHPASSLDDLGTISAESLPGTLRPGVTRRPPQKPGGRLAMGGDSEQASPTDGRDLATMIRDAEQLAETRG